MNQSPDAHPTAQSTRWLFISLSIAILAIGAAVGFWRGQVMDQTMRARLLYQATTMARMIDPALIKELNFSKADRTNSVYLEIRRQMIAYGQANGLNSIYSQTIRNNLILFGPENIDEKSPMASPPGTVYQEPSVENLKVFQTGAPITQGPYTDEYGKFVSAFAPIKDPVNGEILLIVGLDLDASHWNSVLWRERVIPVVLAAVLVCLILYISKIFQQQKSKLGRDN